jgi:hypothetical protein
MLFSKAGFTEALENRAASGEDITLVGIEEMFSVAKIG